MYESDIVRNFGEISKFGDFSLLDKDCPINNSDLDWIHACISMAPNFIDTLPPIFNGDECYLLLSTPSINSLLLTFFYFHSFLHLLHSTRNSGKFW